MPCTQEDADGHIDCVACWVAEDWKLLDEEGKTSIVFMLSHARQNTLVLWRSLHNISGMFTAIRDDIFDRNPSIEEYTDFLHCNFPKLPKVWIPVIAAQLQVGTCTRS